MGSFSDNDDDDGEYQFFDAPDSIPQVSDSGGSNCTRISNSGSGFENGVSLPYDVWINSPRSVGERRKQFRSWMGLGVDGISGEDLEDVCGSADIPSGEIDRMMESTGAVLRASICKDEFSSYQSGLSVEAFNSSKQLGSNEAFLGRNGNVDGGMECNVHDQAENDRQSNNSAVRLERLLMYREPDNSPRASPVIRRLVHGELHVDGGTPRKLNGVKSRLLSRLRSFTCIVNDDGRCQNVMAANSSNLAQRSRVQRVKVRHCRKRLKELSALFVGQDIQAHEGSVLTMKFSSGGQYLASAGEDKIVRVWQVVENMRSNEIDIPELDPSCMYFTVNHLSQLAPLATEKERINKLKGLKKTTESACVIFPPKVFRILEEPLHSFQGHTGEILDLSWSKNDCLLSSSTDKTVRLWQVGHDLCLRVFSHSNYVTCIQFNPVNDEYFISGSIDGKVRIWAVSSCQVLDWTDIRDMVTAVSYHPDGKGGIIGSMAGTCRFFSLEDQEIQLEEQMCLANKKKSICKRITGFQFLPQDPSKVMVTCADSHVRILDGINVIGKYKGQRNAGNHLSATFTSDGKHIISASEDSNVYLWNCDIPKNDYVSHPKVMRSSEFFSSEASIAIPWPGLKTVNPNNGWHSGGLSQTRNSILPFLASPCLSLGRELFLEAIPKGSATWPEEKLPMSSPRSVTSAMRRSEYKFLKSSCHSSSSSHAWGLVIVTAGYDGRIRSFHNYGLPLPL